MKLPSWNYVERKRNKKIRHTDKDFVWYYDIDLEDLSELVSKYNRMSITDPENDRLLKYVLTMMNIVFEHPNVNPRSLDEKEALADHVFMKSWGSLKYIKDGANPYSYLYRSGYTAVGEYYNNLYRTRRKEEAINQHLQQCYDDYMEEFDDHKTPVRPSEEI